jgi:hypothetical protein
MRHHLCTMTAAIRITPTLTVRGHLPLPFSRVGKKNVTRAVVITLRYPAFQALSNQPGPCLTPPSPTARHPHHALRGKAPPRGRCGGAYVQRGTYESASAIPHHVLAMQSPLAIACPIRTTTGVFHPPFERRCPCVVNRSGTTRSSSMFDRIFVVF